MRFLSLRPVRAFAVLLVLTLSAAPARAQDKEEPFFDVNIKKHVKPYVPWIIAVGFMVGCLLIGFKNPHRSHLD